jgi:hypothetical protein
MIFKSSKKLIFYCTIEGVEKTMPIISSKEIKYDWIKRLTSSFTDKNLDVSATFADGKIRNASRCPGIFQIKNQGWILRAWQDIELSLDDPEYKWRTPLNQLNLSEGRGQEDVTHHAEMVLTEHFEHWPENAFSQILKINTPWCVKVPKGYVLNQFHPSYLDDDRFTSLPGTYAPEYGIGTLNVPMIWHSKTGRFLIKAGTPIAQLILSKKENIPFENKAIDNQFKKELKIQDILENMNFKRVYKNIIDYYKKT